ncbi:CxC2 domain-containing protein [Mycena venus]|uniref:CxC2 domain-containing protein n=1 Tax=Mycena venus TaxID=2733690 RepID=A0A8H6WPV4_9AGAR|nr:CxC2 domain-containing protein [Mycena venus]
MSLSTSPYRCNPPYHPDPGKPDTPSAGKKLYLVCGRRVNKPGMYTLWASADAQYKYVSGATVKAYWDYNELRAAWHRHCDLGEHNHPADSLAHTQNSFHGPEERKHAVYKHNALTEETSLSNATKCRVHVQHNPAPPQSPEKGQAFDNFDHLMGFAGDNELPAPILPEGPAALKIKVKKKAKRYNNSEWEDEYFQPRTTRDLKIWYQIGQPFGEDCPTNYLGQSGDFMVLQDNGIHVLDVDFCCCTGAPSQVAQLLNHAPALSQAQPSSSPAYDFYNTLVILSDGMGLQKLLNRLPQFMNMVHKYRHLQMCKRAGCGHDPDGISATTAGELAIPCRACPHPDINVPEDWEKAPPEVAFIYFFHRQAIISDEVITVDLGNSLLRKMVLAIPQAMIHSRAFHSFTAGLREGHEEELTKCERMVREWETDTEDSENPYEYAEVEATTVADVLAWLAAEEHATLICDGTSTLVRSRTLLLGKFKALHDIQDTYMPGLRMWIAQQTPPLPTGNSTTPETIPIYLPSSLPANVRQMRRCGIFVQGCEHAPLPISSSTKNMDWQGAYTKSRELIDGMEDLIRSAAIRHRIARAALYSLHGHGSWEQIFQELRQEDICGMNERALNDKQKEEN